MTAAEAAQDRRQRARKDAELAALLRAAHRRLRLWLDLHGQGFSTPALLRAAKQRLGEWTDDGSAVRMLPQVVTFQWVTPEEAARAGMSDAGQ
jgi:hypothetical protein